MPSVDRLLLWSGVDGSLLRSIDVGASSLLPFDFSPEGDLATGSQDATIRLWDDSAGELSLSQALARKLV